MPVYVKTGPFTNGGAPGISKAFLDAVENQLVTSLQNDATVPVTVTLGGSDKVLIDFVVTDGKHYQLKVKFSDNSLYVYNVTDAIVMFSMAANGASNILVQQATPSTGTKYRVWVKTPFA